MLILNICGSYYRIIYIYIYIVIGGNGVIAINYSDDNDIGFSIIFFLCF